MNKNYILFLFLIGLISKPLIADENSVTHRLFAIANIADIDKSLTYFQHLDSLLSTREEPASLLINGDLINNKIGEWDSLKISSLIELSKKLSKGKLLFLSGERDWDDSGKEGLKRVKGLEKFIESYDYKNVKWLIGKGCPGPKTIDLDENLLLVTLNTQWWNHPYDKPGPQDADCKIADTDNFLEEFEDELSENSDKNIIVLKSL